MSFGGRDDRDGKRKYQWGAYNSGAKRFHGSSNSPREEFHRGVGSGWDRGPKPHEQGFSKSHRSPGNSWGSRERSNHIRSPHPTSNRNYNQVFDFQPSISSGPPKESEELVGPGSDLERMEKVLATKKRIEEALASSSSSSNNKEIHFQNSSISSGDRSKDKESHGPNLDLSLTNSDFKEIGSVASAVTTEGDIEPTDLMINTSSNISTRTSQQRSFDSATDLMINTSSNISTRTSQQRSFDSATLNAAANVQASQPKSQKVGGWSMSAVNNIVPEPNQSCSPRPRSDMYLQQQREEILGNVSTTTQENDSVDPSPCKQSNDNQNYRDEFSRVGRLYQSFLKSRLYGYTLRVRHKSQKLSGPNPLLDKSVLENYNSDKPVTEDQVIELQMPQPIRVKMENNVEPNTEQTPEHIAAEEANEFCKEFSFLLKDPNFLIPPDDLEKLGLGHLREMNKLISDKRMGGASQSSKENQESLLRNLGVLNSVVGSDIGVNINKDALPFSNSHNFGQRESIDRCNERGSLFNNGISHNDTSFQLGSQNPSALDKTMRPDILRNDTILFTQNPQVSAFQNVSVEAVVEKVVKTILQPSNISSVLNASIPSTPEARKNSAKVTNERNLSVEPGTSFSDTKSSPLNQMQDVSSKILRLFLIDKQVEELMTEKMKIYSELLSSQGVSQTLFHSWAQDQIQQGNVMSVVSNTSNVIPELSRVINRNVQEITPSPASNSRADYSLEEAISELYTLKKEYGNPDNTTPPSQESDRCEPRILPPDSCFVPPKDVVLEETRPKLSVRKDLLDPNRSNLSLINTPVKISGMSTEDDVNPSDGTNSADTDRTNTKREKKKKKSKKKDSVEVINLIEDTDDEISSGTGVDSVVTDNLSSKGLNSEDEVDKKDNPLGSSKIAYDLVAKTATCMTVVKLKKSPTKVLVVGCKDGFIMGYALGNPAISFTKKIHNDTITSVYHTHKYLITGSSDSTVCLFSLKEQVEMQTLSVNAPVQSMDINFQQLIVGTKAGSIYSYTIKVGDKKKAFVSLHPNKKSLTITNSSILAVKLAKEGARKVLIVASRGEQITVRDSVSGLLLRTFDWCDTVYCLQLYEETPLVYCGTNTKSVKVVNYTDGENTGDCMIGRSITQIIFLQSIMFAASYDGNIYVYDVEKKSLMATVIISKGIIQCLAIDGKSNVILVASSRGDLQQIPFPASVAKHVRKLKIEKKKNQNINMMPP